MARDLLEAVVVCLVVISRFLQGCIDEEVYFLTRIKRRIKMVNKFLLKIHEIPRWQKTWIILDFIWAIILLFTAIWLFILR